MHNADYPRRAAAGPGAGDSARRYRFTQTQRNGRLSTSAIKDCHVRSNMPEEKSGIDNLDSGLHIAFRVSAWSTANPIFEKNSKSYRWSRFRAR
jgi:hypothetical protein